MSAKQIYGKIIRFLGSEEGPTAVEYAVMLMLILMAVIGTVQFFGGALSDSFDNSNDALKEALEN